MRVLSSDDSSKLSSREVINTLSQKASDQISDELREAVRCINLGLIPGLQWGSCYSIFSFLCSVLQIVVYLFVSLFCPLCCLSFDLRLLITPLVSSNFSSKSYWRQDSKLHSSTINLCNHLVLLDIVNSVFQVTMESADVHVC